MTLPILKNKPYGNCAVYHPDGFLMFYCSVKQRKWYLSRSLAEEISENSIKLTFRPKGIGLQGSMFLHKRENKCCRCGGENNLTRHHLVPHNYRKHLPLQYKEYTAHDIVALCNACHEEYEIHSGILKKKIGHLLNVKFGSLRVDTPQYLGGYASVLLSQKNTLPYSRMASMEDAISDYLGRDYTKEDLENLLSKPKFVSTEHSKKAVEYYLENGTIECFLSMWRLHFIECMKPIYMHALPSVDNGRVILDQVDKISTGW